MELTRRVLLVAWGAFVVTPNLTSAQPARKTARVGWVGGAPGVMPTPEYLEAFREGMRGKGWIEGQNLVIEARWGTRDQAREFAGEFLQSKVDVIVTQGPMVFGARAVAGTIPIVFAVSGDPIESKLVASLARPGGSLTGMTFLGLELVGKRIDLLKETLPGLARIAILANPDHPGEQTELKESQAAARRLGVNVQYLPVSSLRDFDAAYDAIARERAEAIVVFPDGLVMAQAKAIAAFATRHRVPAISGWDVFVEAGNVMSYGPNLRESWRQMAGYVDKILRGAKPADLPVELPTKLELVINARAAKAIGLTIPPAVLVRADRIIE